MARNLKSCSSNSFKEVSQRFLRAFCFSANNCRLVIVGSLLFLESRFNGICRSPITSSHLLIQNIWILQSAYNLLIMCRINIFLCFNPLTSMRSFLRHKGLLFKGKKQLLMFNRPDMAFGSDTKHSHYIRDLMNPDETVSVFFPSCEWAYTQKLIFMAAAQSMRAVCCSIVTTYQENSVRCYHSKLKEGIK